MSQVLGDDDNYQAKQDKQMHNLRNALCLGNVITFKLEISAYLFCFTDSHMNYNNDDFPIWRLNMLLSKDGFPLYDLNKLSWCQHPFTINFSRPLWW